MLEVVYESLHNIKFMFSTIVTHRFNVVSISHHELIFRTELVLHN